MTPGWRLDIHDSLTSTSDHCIARAEQGEPPGLAVLAHRQTRARGSRGRSWTGSDGNLALSVLLRPQGVLARSTLWPFLSALALQDALAHACPDAGWSLKWPNDVLLRGAKVAGILVERGIGGGEDWLVIGFGANLAVAPELPDRRTACLAELGPAPTAVAVAGRILDALDHWCRVATQGGFVPIRDAWLARAHPPGTPLAIEARGERRAGSFAGLSDDGALLLRVDDRLERFATGEILLLDGR